MVPHNLVGMSTPLRRRAHDFLTENPAWSSWVDGQDEIWRQHNELREQGYTAAEANARLGLVPDDDVDELKTQLQRQHDSIARQAATITAGTRENQQLRDENEHLKRDNRALRRELAAFQEQQRGRRFRIG